MKLEKIIEKINNKEKHWNIVIICCGLAGAAIGISFNTSGVFYNPVSKNLNILKGVFSFHMTIFTLVMAFSSLLIPKMVKIISYKKILIVGVIMSTISTAMMGMVKSVSLFYILGAVRGFSTSMYSNVPISIIINRWFIKKNGLAMSIVFSCSGLIGVFISPLLAKCIEIWGWQIGYVIKSIILFMLCLPAIIYPFKINPIEEGLQPYEDDSYENNSTKILENKNNKKEEKIFYSKITFINMIFFSIFICFLTGVPQHFSGYSVSLGYSESIGAIILSSGMMGNIISKLLVGILSDKIGPIRATSVLILSILTGIILLFLGNKFMFLIIGAFLFGACYGIAAVSISLLTSYFFGVEKYMSVFPITSFIANVGSALSISIIGFIYDFTKSYKLAFLLSGVMVGVSLIFISIAICDRKKNILKNII